MLLSCRSSRTQKIWSTGSILILKKTSFDIFVYIIFAFSNENIAIQLSFVFKGWNKSYPFNTGDLVISMNVLYNYLEANNRIPWEDLRYLFGEIMYGGHITDDWDRRLCKVILILSIIMLWMH